MQYDRILRDQFTAQWWTLASDAEALLALPAWDYRKEKLTAECVTR
jgi:hypothetical protein